MVDKKQISKLYSAAKLSETEQSVLEYLLNNIDTLDDIGIKPVAMACFTSMRQSSGFRKSSATVAIAK